MPAALPDHADIDTASAAASAAIENKSGLCRRPYLGFTDIRHPCSRQTYVVRNVLASNPIQQDATGEVQRPRAESMVGLWEAGAA